LLASILNTHNPWFGLFTAIIAGGLVGLLHGFLSVTLRINQLVSGLAINLVASGITSFLARLIFNGSTQRLPEIAAITIPGLSQIPIIGKLLFQQDIFVYLLLFLIILTTYKLLRRLIV
jgi:ABC-type uncharacterized transport system permease subunit